jgi:anti-sigma regulatory factor (Ser/Thr protein kinase)
VCEQFAGELRASELASAKLLISELVTNAVVHGGGGIGLSVRLDGECLRVDVSDDGKRFTPAIRTPVLGRGGLGLELVEDIATHWGIGEEATTHVWFELGRTSPNGPVSSSPAGQ